MEFDGGGEVMFTNSLFTKSVKEFLEEGYLKGAVNVAHRVLTQNLILHI